MKTSHIADNIYLTDSNAFKTKTNTNTNANVNANTNTSMNTSGK